MTQMTLEDHIERVDMNTDIVARKDLDTAIELCARKHYIFHTDDIWQYAPHFTGNKKALAGALRRAIDKKIVSHDGFAKSESTTRHHGITSRYKSEIYRGL